MILGSDILSKLIIDLCFSDNTIRVNGDANKEFMARLQWKTFWKLNSTHHPISLNKKGTGTKKYGR